jgi:hypothetical protein
VLTIALTNDVVVLAIKFPPLPMMILPAIATPPVTTNAPDEYELLVCVFVTINEVVAVTEVAILTQADSVELY